MRRLCKRFQRPLSFGSAMIMAMLLACLLISVVGIITRFAGLVFERQRRQLKLDALLQSYLAVRADSLWHMARKGDFIEAFGARANEQGLFIARRHWNEFRKSAHEFRLSIPGYKGRLSSSLNVVGQSNHIKREDVVWGLGHDVSLGIDPQRLQITDENNNSAFVTGAWAQRNVEFDHPVTLTLRGNSLWGSKRLSSSGILVWDGAGREGGFKGSWIETLDEGQSRPYRNPYYRVVIK